MKTLTTLAVAAILTSVAVIPTASYAQTKCKKVERKDGSTYRVCWDDSKKGGKFSKSHSLIRKTLKSIR